MKHLLAMFVISLALTVTAQAWWNDDWSIRKKITIDTTGAGGNINDPIGTTPVLIRLLDGFFQFASATYDGSDIRFIADYDMTPLVYHIEKYDSLLGEAFLWVQVPNLKPGAQTNLWLYYGNTAGTKPAPGAADAKGTYDSDTVLVYHFADKTGQPPQDATSSPFATIDKRYSPYWSTSGRSSGLRPPRPGWCACVRAAQPQRIWETIGSG